ncbi:TPA: hypothetical protein ACNIQM_001844 [Citrobacter werkmanii]
MKKVKWPKLPRFFVPLFECANVYLCRTREEFGQAMEALGLEREDVSCFGGCVRRIENKGTGERLILVCVFTGQLHVLAHECAHAAFRICEYCGVDIDPSGTNETYCYMLDKLFLAFADYVDGKK